MGRNNADFKSCPECYGHGYIGYGEEEVSNCPTCEGAGARSMEDQSEDMAARADQERGK